MQQFETLHQGIEILNPCDAEPFEQCVGRLVRSCHGSGLGPSDIGALCTDTRLNGHDRNTSLAGTTHYLFQFPDIRETFYIQTYRRDAVVFYKGLQDCGKVCLCLVS